MSELPLYDSLFEAPREQRVEPGQANDYVGLYTPEGWIAVVILNPSGFRFGKTERWHPTFDCVVPQDLKDTLGSQSIRYFALWFHGIPSERGRYGLCIREVRITRIMQAKEGRDYTPEEWAYLRTVT